MHCDGCSRCAPVSDPASLRHKTEEVNKLLRSMNVAVLPAFEESLLHAHGHIGLVSTARGARDASSFDCTHLCEPAPLFDRLNVRLRDVVRSMA
jgi:hypothetical protein